MPSQSTHRADAARMPARYFAVLCELLKRLGADVDRILNQANIWPTQLYGPDATVTVEQLENLIAAATEVSGRNDLGFLLGREIKLSNHEILGYAVMTSPTFDYALRLASRYYRLITLAFKMQYRRDAKLAELSFQPVLMMNAQLTRFLLETVVVSTHAQIQSLMQPRVADCNIYVSYPEPEPSRHYAALRSTHFHFEADTLPGARIVLEASVVAEALPMADRGALQMAEQRCEQLLQRTAGSGGMTEWISMMLREARDASPTLAELAHLLNLSPRTLDRHLAREGVRFLELSKRIRHEKACKLLRKSSLPITQIAYQLGYKEIASFTRAFSREAGQNPSDYRRIKTPQNGEGR